MTGPSRVGKRTVRGPAGGTRHGLPPEARVWLYIDRSGDGCWEWTGSRSKSGYGRLQLSRNPTRLAQAHRLVFEIVNGPIPPGMSVCHECDNPPCCRPAHLFLGTHADNMADMVAKGRHHHQRYQGEEHPRARLTALDVRAIRLRQAAGEQPSVLMAEFEIGPSQLYRILRREAWGHVA